VITFLVVDHAGPRLLPGMDDFAARAAARWQAIDQLLPDPVPAEPGPDCGARLAVGAGGNLAAFGACCHVRPDPDGIDLSWGMARRFELSPRVLGPDAAGALDRLIRAWREHLASVPGSAADDTAAVVTWPSRDIEGVAALQAHGLQPLAVVAIRPGAALAARLHDVVDDDGIAATLLHYEQLNPYAAPFWSRLGYRPLWTIWEARPARTLRLSPGGERRRRCRAPHTAAMAPSRPLTRRQRVRRGRELLTSAVPALFLPPPVMPGPLCYQHALDLANTTAAGRYVLRRGCVI
jgi:hypothetical protein